jgi:magnesium transporter
MGGKQNRRRKRRNKWVPTLSTYAPPGTLTADPDAGKPLIRLIAYGPDTYIDLPITSIRQIQEHRGKHPVLWVNIDGMGDAEVIRSLGELFGLHKLALEDMLQTGQRPKVDEYESFQLIVARMIDRSNDRLGTEQLSMILGKDYVLTFQERPGDCLDAIRLRAKEHRGRVRDAGADYLAYAILDAIVDEYFPVLEAIGDRLEDLEDAALIRPKPGTATRVHLIKRDLLVLRRAMWPQREAVNALQRGTSPLISADTRIYLRDCYDHCVQVLDLIEVYRELGTGLQEMYMTSMNHRMNEVMRLLAIISTIFMPLTFIAGIYGMNFQHFPELGWRWGYPLVLASMLLIGSCMVVFFWRKGWMGQRGKQTGEHENDES